MKTSLNDENVATPPQRRLQDVPRKALITQSPFCHVWLSQSRLTTLLILGKGLTRVGTRFTTERTEILKGFP